MNKEGYGKTSIRGIASTAASQAIKVGTTVVTTTIVARLLSPSEYGVSAMAGPVAGFIVIFQNLGLNQAVVQAKMITDEESNALFWINMYASLAIALVMLAIGPLVGRFYGDPRPGYFVAATGLVVLVSGLKQQHQALMNREMRFHSLSLNDSVAAIVTLVATVGCAFYFHNYWALFFGGLAGAVASSLMMWIGHGWRPQWRPGIRAARTMIGFGANVTGFNLVNFLARNADNVLIARFSGAAAVGLYDRSYKLMLFPLQNINAPMSRVMVPALSRLQDHPERYRRAYLLSLRALVLVSMPGVIAIAIASRPVVLLLLGQKWQSAVPIFFWLSLTAIVQIVANTTGWLFISSGRAREMMRWGLVSSLVSITSFIVGLPWGPVGVAKAYFASQVVCLPFLYWYSCKQSPIDYQSLYRLQLPTVAGGLVAWLLSRNIPGESGVSYILPIVVLSYVCCWISELIFPEGRQALKEYIVMARKATS